MAQGMILSDKSRDGIAAVLAVNLGDLEGDMYQLQQDWDATEARFDGMERSMEEAGLRVLNGPNLLKQPEFVTVKVPLSAVISEELTVPVETAAQAAEALTFTVTDASITGSYKLHGIKSGDYDVVNGSMVSATFASGSATVTIAARSGAHSKAVTVTVYLCTQKDALLPYGEISRCYGTNRPYLDSFMRADYIGQENDEISESVVILKPNAYSATSAYAVGDKCVHSGLEYQCNTAIGSGGEAWNASHWDEIPAEWLTEADGSEYGRAIAFTVSSVPASGQNNRDTMVFNYGNFTVRMEDGEPAYPRTGQVDEMVAGQTYTLSCWARVTGGTKMKLFFGSSVYNGQMSKVPNGSGYVEIDAKGGEWQRVSFTFAFNPDGEQFYTFTNSGNTYQACYWTKTVGFGVCRAYAGTVQLCGFRLARGKMWVCETYDDLEERVGDLEDVLSVATTEEAEAIISEYGGGS